MRATSCVLLTQAVGNGLSENIERVHAHTASLEAQNGWLTILNRNTISSLQLFLKLLNFVLAPTQTGD